VSGGLDERPELRQRFEREARIVSSLSHPHICPLFDVGEATLGDRAADAGRPIRFFVMEFLEGETLAVRLRKGALPIDQVLRNAIEIASALDAAHRRGIVHRDLKPGNIMLTRSGVKLLDFGLAKIESALLEPRALPANTRVEGSDALMPTVEAPLTAEHTVLGTLNYMAPEQLEGREADARSDLFAFGAVVYEMAAGRKPFDGPTRAAVTAMILERDPEPVTRVQPQVPPVLEHLVTRCLQKDPDDRWQTARDLLAELQWIKNSSGTTVSSGHALAPPIRSRRRRPLLAFAAGVAALGVLAAAMFTFGRNRDQPLMTQLDVVTPPTSDPYAFALSPDVPARLRRD
jgi:serine/threonine protein kinase